MVLPVHPSERLASRGDLYARFVDQELDRETQIRLSLDQRCLAVVSAAGVFATLLLAAVAVASRPDGPARWSAPWLLKATVGLALVGYVSAAGSGFSAIRPRAAASVDARELEDVVWKSLQDWHTPQATLSWDLTRRRVDMLADYQRYNERKAALIDRAITGVVAGILLTAGSVVLILTIR